MIHWRLPRYRWGPITFTYRAIILGTTPMIALVGCFEAITPDGLMADGITIPHGVATFDLSRLVLFISIGTVHILLCAVVTFLSISTIKARLARPDVRPFVMYGIVMPLSLVTLGFILVCALTPKIYRISYTRVIDLLKQLPQFSYQFDTCTHHWWLQSLCPSGNFHIGFFGFALIFSGLVASITVCADIGVSSFHHAKTLTPKRLFLAGKEMRDDINRYAVCLLLVLTSSSVATAAFQPVGISLLKTNPIQLELYEHAALAASLFWPFAFTSIFLGIFVVPALSIMTKRTEALRLLDANEISNTDYENFFAVREAMPQSFRWMLMSGLPLLMSLAPRLVGFAN